MAKGEIMAAAKINDKGLDWRHVHHIDVWLDDVDHMWCASAVSADDDEMRCLASGKSRDDIMAAASKMSSEHDVDVRQV